MIRPLFPVFEQEGRTHVAEKDNRDDAGRRPPVWGWPTGRVAPRSLLQFFQHHQQSTMIDPVALGERRSLRRNLDKRMKTKVANFMGKIRLHALGIR